MIRQSRTGYAGSKAYGDDGPVSDYDFLVVAPDNASADARSSRLGYQALRGTGIAADVVVCSQGYFEARTHLQTSLPGTVLREGRLLHAA